MFFGPSLLVFLFVWLLFSRLPIQFLAAMFLMACFLTIMYVTIPGVAAADSKTEFEDKMYDADLLMFFCTIVAVILSCLAVCNRQRPEPSQDRYQSVCEELRLAKAELANMQKKFLDSSAHPRKNPGPEMRLAEETVLFCLPKGEVFHANQFCQGGKVGTTMKGYRVCKICAKKLAGFVL